MLHRKQLRVEVSQLNTTSSFQADMDKYGIKIDIQISRTLIRKQNRLKNKRTNCGTFLYPQKLQKPI